MLLHLPYSCLEPSTPFRQRSWALPSPVSRVLFATSEPNANSSPSHLRTERELGQERQKIPHKWLARLNLEDDDDLVLLPANWGASPPAAQTYTAYKRVDRKVRPVSTTMPVESRVRRTIPEDPIRTLPPLPFHPPKFVPTARLSRERLAMMEVNHRAFLLPEEEQLFNHVLRLNEEAIAFEDVERGTLKDSYFSPYVIPTVPHRPWQYRNIPIPPGLKERVNEVLKLKIEAGVYEPSVSSYRSMWFCVMKKNGKLRIVHDLQPLNKVTVRDAGQLPILDDFVEGFAGRQCYTVFDLYWGFDARKIDESSREMTAFMTPLGLLQITSLPTGFTNSPAEFQKCMVFVLQEDVPDLANIFIDDLAIKGPKTQYPDHNGEPERLRENPGIRRFVWEHAQDVHRIMHRIKCAGATFSGHKAQICRPEALIVGQRCNAQGRFPDATRADKILKWPQLKDANQVRRFLGLCGTVRIWIRDYSSIIRPLTQLYHKEAPFVWGHEQQEAFERIKQAVSSAPAMKPIDYESGRTVVLSVDSSKDATGMILSQLDEKGRKVPARYGSLPMSERESRYSQPKLELFGLYRALRHWRIYLVGVQHLRVEVDAQYIRGMLKEPDLQPNATINRWIQGILLFDFELVHVPATKFKGPDALSRRPPDDGEERKSDDDSWLDKVALLIRRLRPETRLLPKHLTFYHSLQLPSCLLSRKAQENWIAQVRHFLQTLETPYFSSVQAKKRFLTKANRYLMKGERLFRLNRANVPLLVVQDPEVRLRILTMAHEQLGHKGVLAVLELLQQRFHWPHMRNDVRHHIKSCHECQLRSLRRFEKPPTVSLPVSIFGKVYIDVMFMPPAGGYRYIVAARDDLTGVCEARALTSIDSKSLARFFWEQIYCRYGVPLQVVTDNGSEVRGAFDHLMHTLNIPQIRISPYNKHANGVVERGHFVLREALVKACEGRLSQWPKFLPLAVFADRITIHRTTGFSPYHLLHATDPVLPFDLFDATFQVEGFYAGMTTEDLLVQRIRQLQKHPEDLAKAAQTLSDSRFASKAQFEKRFARRLLPREFKPAELVLVRNSEADQNIGMKGCSRYMGPYEVVRRTKGEAYRLKELDGAELASSIAAYRLMPYIQRDHWFMRTGWLGTEKD